MNEKRHFERILPLALVNFYFVFCLLIFAHFTSENPAFSLLPFTLQSVGISLIGGLKAFFLAPAGSIIFFLWPFPITIPLTVLLSGSVVLMDYLFSRTKMEEKKQLFSTIFASILLSLFFATITFVMVIRMMTAY